MAEVSFPTNVTVIPEGGSSIEAGESPLGLQECLTELKYHQQMTPGKEYWVTIEVGGEYKEGRTEILGMVVIPVKYKERKTCRKRVRGTWLFREEGWIHGSYGGSHTLPHPSFSTSQLTVEIDGTVTILDSQLNAIFPQARHFYELQEGVTLEEFEKDPTTGLPLLRFNLDGTTTVDQTTQP